MSPLSRLMRVHMARFIAPWLAWDRTVDSHYGVIYVDLSCWENW
jgi:hypothetical protein